MKVYSTIIKSFSAFRVRAQVQESHASLSDSTAAI